MFECKENFFPVPVLLLPHHMCTLLFEAPSAFVLQGNLTAAVSDAYGWDVLFGVLCVFAVFSGLLLLPATLAELKKKPAQ